MNFSVNQVRQLYVVKDGYSESSVSAASNVGTIGNVTTITDCNDKEVYFLYKGALDVLKSDIIQVKNIGCVKAYDASTLATKMRKVSISINPTVNGGAPVAGQDYVLGINFKNFFSSGDDSQYYKDAAVHVTSAITNAKQLFDAMKNALDKAFSREDGATATSNPYLAFSVSGSGDSAKLVIEEKPQEWEHGKMKQKRVYFDVFPSLIYTGGDDVNWAKQEDTGYYFKEETPTTTVGNGKKIADLEWFCLGERGDQYRGMGYPNTIHTEYLVDPSASYHVLEIHYAFTDTGVNSYRTEKEITIVAPTAKKAALNSFITAFNTATGLSVATLE